MKEKHCFVFDSIYSYSKWNDFENDDNEIRLLNLTYNMRVKNKWCHYLLSSNIFQINKLNCFLSYKRNVIYIHECNYYYRYLR